MGIGSEICSKFCSSNGFESVVFMMEYLPIPATTKLIAENAENIQTLINRMHSLGIYHGDLHGGNIAFTKKMEPRIIDLDTVFYANELDSKIVKLWAEKGFDMTVPELIEWEREENWKLVPDS